MTFGKQPDLDNQRGCEDNTRLILSQRVLVTYTLAI